MQLHGPAAFYRGDTWKIAGSLFNADGTVFDLSGAATLSWIMVDATGSTILEFSIGSGITVINVAGQCLIVVTAAQSANIPVGSYKDQLRATDAAGEPDTLWTGTIQVRASLFTP